MSLDRARKLGRLHVLKKMAGLDDDTYRDKLQRVTGLRSAKDCSDAQLDQAIASFHVRQNPNQAGTTRPAYISKVKALWIALWNLGALESGRDIALDAFVERQTGKQKLAFVTPVEANAITEALKAMALREGFGAAAHQLNGMQVRQELVRQQWKKLAAIGAVRIADEFALSSWLSGRYLTFHGNVIHLTREQLDDAARTLGSWIRKAQKPAAERKIA